VMRAAERAGIEPVLMATYMSHFFEAVIDQVTMKKVVRIPGFGSLGPKTRFRQVSSKFWGDRPTAFPAFVASPRFKLEVRMHVRPALSPESDPMRRLLKNNSYRRRLNNKPLDETFANIRRAITDCNDGSARAQRQKII